MPTLNNYQVFSMPVMIEGANSSNVNMKIYYYDDIL